MRSLSRVAVLLLFFVPLATSVYFFLSPTFSLFLRPDLLVHYWTSYVKISSSISIFVGLSSAVMAIQISFLIGYCIFSLRKSRIEKYIALFLSVPHLAFFSGVLFLISSSGIWARIWNLFSNNSFYGFDRDPLALSFAATLALKESLFLLFVMLPLIFEKKNEAELVLTQSYGHTEFTFWTHVLWPRVLKSIQYPIWMVIAFSVSVVDLAIVLAPTNPPPFSVVLWEFFRSSDLESQTNSLLGSINILFILLVSVFIWESLVKIFLMILKLRLLWPIKSRFLIFRKPILSVYFLFQLAPVVVLSIWAFTDEWVFPHLLPTSYTVDNFINGIAGILPQIITTVNLAFLSSILSTLACLIWLEWDRLALKKWMMIPILFVSVFPIIPLLFGFDIFLASTMKPNSFFSVLYIHLFLVFPYIYIILKNHFGKFDERYKTVTLSLGQSAIRFFIKVRLPMILGGIMTAFSVGFAVSVSQFVSTVFIGGGRIETLTTQMVVAASGENRKWIGVFGILQILIPALVFYFSSLVGKEKN